MTNININGNLIDLENFKDSSPAYKVKEKLLDAVIFEIQHDPHLEAMSKKHEIVKMFPSEHPQIKFSTTGNALEDGLLFDFDDCALVTYSQKTSFEFRGYQSFVDFQQRVTGFFSEYNKILPMPSIYRVGLRYVNKIAIKKDELMSPSGMFTLNLNFINDPIQFFSLDFTHVVENGLLARSMFTPRFDQNDAFLFWDNDIFLPIRMDFKTAMGLLPVLHQAATNLFLKFLSDQAKQKLLLFGDKK